MVRRIFRFLLASAGVLAVVLLLRRTFQLREDRALAPSPDPWPPLPEPAPQAPAPQAPGPVPAWLPPVDGDCPPTHPVKVKTASGIYHLPGMVNYARTKPDRCYAEEDAAVADGFVRSKR
jgi:hypothetical protein